MSQEKIVQKQGRLSQLQRAVLTTCAVGGIAIVTVMAPNVVGIIARLLKKEMEKRRMFPYSVFRSAKNLERKGFIQRALQNGKESYVLTQAGRQILARQTHVTNASRRSWDKRWRMLVFDITERRRKIRDTVRRILTKKGFVRLQDSVWVYPYDVEDMTTLLKTEYKLGPSMLYVIAASIENDKWLRRHFDLKV